MGDGQRGEVPGKGKGSSKNESIAKLLYRICAALIVIGLISTSVLAFQIEILIFAIALLMARVAFYIQVNGQGRVWTEQGLDRRARKSIAEIAFTISAGLVVVAIREVVFSAIIDWTKTLCVIALAILALVVGWISLHDDDDG